MKKNIESVYCLAGQIEIEAKQLSILTSQKGWNNKNLTWELMKTLSAIRSCKSQIEMMNQSLKEI
jgi:hypothetical protein